MHLNESDKEQRSLFPLRNTSSVTNITQLVDCNHDEGEREGFISLQLPLATELPHRKKSERNNSKALGLD